MKLWGGRFSGETDELMRRFNASLLFDARMFHQDITGSIAWARALKRSGLLSAEETNQIIEGLDQVRRELAEERFTFSPSDEDIHTAVERRLTELIGPAGGKLHTGRSRNDQVATDLRLYLMEQLKTLREAVIHLQTAIVEKAEIHLDVIMPGYTHLQQAQPISFGHWLMSYFWKIQRDKERLDDAMKRISVLPLGAGALAGNPLRIDRRAIAEELGFATVSPNSLDAVADRDFVVEILSWAALLQVHLSSLAEDLIIWSSREFGYVELDDAYVTGSSLMPQKKNPDALELIRGKTGRIAGNLVSLLMTLKGLPSTYNKDLQEDKETLFDTLDTLAIEIPIVTGVIRTLKVFSERISASMDSSMLATDLADYLVRKGIPFRQCHHLVGQSVRRAEELGVSLAKLELAEYQAIHPAFDLDLYESLDFQRSVDARNAEGGTAPAAIRRQIVQARTVLI